MVEGSGNPQFDPNKQSPFFLNCCAIFMGIKPSLPPFHPLAGLHGFLVFRERPLIRNPWIIRSALCWYWWAKIHMELTANLGNMLMGAFGGSSLKIKFRGHLTRRLVLSGNASFEEESNWLNGSHLIVTLRRNTTPSSWQWLEHRV